MSFVQRGINATISLGQGDYGESGFKILQFTNGSYSTGQATSPTTFSESGTNTGKFFGLRVSAAIQKWGTPSLNSAVIRIYGLPQSVMNDVTSLWLPVPEYRDNRIVLEAVDNGSQASIVFEGGIQRAMIHMDMPDASLEIVSLTAYKAAMRPVPPLSFAGPTDAAVIMEQLANTMDLTFENNGVSVILSSPYFPGTALQQAHECADAADIVLYIDDKKLAIHPKDGSRNSTIVEVSPATGLVGYPSFNGSEIMLRTLYNPKILWGGKVQVNSSIPQACGVWWIYGLTHNLESQTVGGNWFTDMVGRRLPP